MNTELIRFFGVTVKSKSQTQNLLQVQEDFKTINQLGANCGYFVMPDACTPDVKRFLQEESQMNPNATFYASFNDVISKTRLELFFDQILHYMTTYGTDFSLGNGYVPRELTEQDIPSWNLYKSCKVITAITEEEMYERCMNVLKANIALKQETMQVIADYIIDMWVAGTAPERLEDCIDAIANKEALIYVAFKTGLMPKDKFKLFRYIIYKTTGSTMIIKSKGMIESIVTSANPFDFSKLPAESFDALASIFYRFKPLFLAFKHNNVKDQSYIINRLRRMAKTKHVPMKPGFWDQLFVNCPDIEDVKAEAEKLSNFKKVSLIQACRLRRIDPSNDFYLIRNGKTWMQPKIGKSQTCSMDYVCDVEMALYNSLVDSLKKNAVKTETVITEDGEEMTVSRPAIIAMNNDVHITMPSTEKSFIGNLPIGTSYDLSNHNFVGVYWRDEWGTRDYDLSMLTIEGDRFSWCDRYSSSSNNIVYSGDMTYADPEASEMFYIKKDIKKDMIVSVNKYSGDVKSQLKLYLGQENITKLERNYMVRPDSIRLSTMVDMNDINQRCLGFFFVEAPGKVKFRVLNFKVPGGRVLTANDSTMAQIQYFKETADMYLDARQVFTDAGFVVSEIQADADYDFIDLKKDSLISLMR